MITPRWYQKEAITAIYNYFANGGTGNPLVALPTASGKSIVPAIFIQQVMREWPNQRFLMITHVKELIVQNYNKLTEVWMNAPVGIFSAGLKSRDIINPIVFGGIQSMIKVAQAFGHRDIIFIDEAHLVSPDESSMYQKFIAAMRAINPRVKIVGLTATPFRVGQGLLIDDGLFTDIVYDMTDVQGFNKLIGEGFLSPLIPHKTKTELDVTGVGIQKGEFIASQLQGAVDKAEVTWKGLQEALEVAHTTNRKSWIIFSSGIEHAEHIAEMLMQMGIDCAAVHSKQKPEYNDAALKAHKNLELKAVSSYSKLTTGLDHPAIDFILDFRPTLSVVLHIQKYGRGMRPYPGKDHCIVMDYARNVPTLGCVNDPVLPKKKSAEKGDIPVKLCEICGAYNHISARVCCDCGEEFQFKVKITPKAGTHELIKQATAPIFNEYDVTYVIYDRRQKDGGKPFILVTYFCGFKKTFKEVVFPENHKYPKPFIDWWRQRHKVEPPKTTDECMMFISELRSPRKLRVHEDKKPYPEILGVVW